MQRDGNEKTSGVGRPSSGLGAMQSPGMMGSVLVSGIGHVNNPAGTDLESRALLLGSEEEDARMFETNKQDLFLETDDNQEQMDDQQAEQQLDQLN